MELRWLEAFIAVAEELHFGRAAARLRMAQSPLSQAIRKLEREIGAPLFERSTRSVALTSAGHALLEHAYRVVEELDLARRAARSTTAEYGRVSIGFSGALNNLTLPPLTRVLRERYPEISLSLVGQVLTVDAVERLQRGTLDLSFIALPVDERVVETRVIAREPLGATLPSDHRLAGRDEIDLLELADDPFIAVPLSNGAALYEVMVHACLEAGFRPRIVQEVADAYMVLSFVGAGVGVSLMPTCMASIVPSGAVFVPLRSQVVLDTALAWVRSNTSRALRLVLDASEEVLPTPPPRG